LEFAHAGQIEIGEFAVVLHSGRNQPLAAHGQRERARLARGLVPALAVSLDGLDAAHPLSRWCAATIPSFPRFRGDFLLLFHLPKGTGILVITRTDRFRERRLERRAPAARSPWFPRTRHRRRTVPAAPR